MKHSASRELHANLLPHRLQPNAAGQGADEQIQPRICFLDPHVVYTEERIGPLREKFARLAAVGDTRLIGLSPDHRLQVREVGGAVLYLLPSLQLPGWQQFILLCVPLLAMASVIANRTNIFLTACHSTVGLPMLAARGLLGLVGRRPALILETHGDIWISYSLGRRFTRYRILRRLKERAARRALRGADAIRTISRRSSEQVKEEVGRTDATEFPAWIDFDLFQGEDGERWSEVPTFVFASGALLRLKGIHVLVEAVHRLHQEGVTCRVLIYGNPLDQTYFEELRSQVARYGLENCIAMTGRKVPQPELARALAESWAVVLPSFSEGLPRILLEAMISGRIAIGTEVGGIPQVVLDGKNGFLVPPGDVEALAERLRWCVEHPREVRAMGREARAWVLETYSMDRYVDSYRSLFRTALSRLSTSG